MRKAGWRGLAIAMAIGLIGAACGSDDDGGSADSGGSVDSGGSGTEAPDTTAEAASGEPVRVGILLPMTGVFSAFGESFMEGLEYWADEQQQILGRPIELVLLDDGGTPDTGVAAAERLIEQDQVDIILGSTAGAIVAAILPLVTDAEVFHVSFSSLAAASDAASYPFSFMTQWRKTDEGFSMLRSLCEFDVSSVGVIAVNQPVGAETTEAVESRVDEAGCDIEVVGTEQYESGATDVSAQISAVADAEAIVVASGSSPDFAVVLNGLAEAGYEGLILGNDTLGAESTVSLVPEDLYDQMLPFGWTDQTLVPLSDEVQAWSDGLEEFLGGPPKLLSAAYNAYGAAEFARLAAEGSGSLEAADMAAWLEENEVCVPLTCYNFTPEDHNGLDPSQNVPYAVGSRDEMGWPSPAEVG